MKKRKFWIAVFAMFFWLVFRTSTFAATEQVRLAYISDSAGSSAPYWIAKEAGFYKKYGLDVELIFINGSTRGIQSLIAGDLDFAGAVGTSAINGKLAGGDIYIIDSLVNTLPYYIIGKPTIKSPEDLKGRTLATHIPGTSADFAVRLALRRFGIDYKDIRAVMVGGSTARVAAVINGQTDFTMVTETGKASRQKCRHEGDHRHGQAQNSISVQLHGYVGEDDPRQSEARRKHGQVLGRSGALFQNPQERIYPNHGEIYSRSNA